jgi:hypothetical protein
LHLHNAEVRNDASKTEEEKGSKDREGWPPQWLRDRWAAGEKFNVENRPRYPYNEVEVQGENKKYRVDSYDPVKGEIVSRRLTQLAKVKTKTAEGYFNEFLRKYPAGAQITNSQFNPKDLRGEALRGKLIFEIPEQDAAVPPAIKSAAQNRGIILRDPTGRVY